MPPPPKKEVNKVAKRLHPLHFNRVGLIYNSRSLRQLYKKMVDRMLSMFMVEKFLKYMRIVKATQDE